MPKRVPNYRRRPLTRAVPKAYVDESAYRKAALAWYANRRWIALRNAYRREHPLCEECKHKGIYVAMAHVHHIIDRKARPDLAYTWANLQSLCVSCHSIKTREAARAAAMPPAPERE